MTWLGTFTPDGNSITHPVVSAVAVNVYFVDVVSFPDSGVATTAHLPAKSASVTGGGAGAGAAAAALVVSCAGCSFVAHAATARRAEHSSALRRNVCITVSGIGKWGEAGSRIRAAGGMSSRGVERLPPARGAIRRRIRFAITRPPGYALS